MTLIELKKIIRNIYYKGWTFRILEKVDGFLLQTEFMARDSRSATEELLPQKGRKWYISSYACEGEIVRTVYKAIEASELHELQENFRYQGSAIFDPHLNPSDLVHCIENADIMLSIRNSPAMSRANNKEKNNE